MATLKELHKKHKKLHGDRSVSYETFRQRMMFHPKDKCIKTPSGEMKLIKPKTSKETRYSFEEEFENNFFKKRALDSK